MRTLDLGYWDIEKDCHWCGQINHYSKDCKHRNDPEKKYYILIDNIRIGTVKARTEYRARQDAQWSHWYAWKIWAGILDRDKLWHKLEAELIPEQALIKA